MQKSVHEMIESAEFKRMVSKRWTISIKLLIFLKKGSTSGPCYIEMRWPEEETWLLLLWQGKDRWGS